MPPVSRAPAQCTPLPPAHRTHSTAPPPAAAAALWRTSDAAGTSSSKGQRQQGDRPGRRSSAPYGLPHYRYARRSCTAAGAVAGGSHSCKIKRRGTFIFNLCAFCTGKLYHFAIPLYCSSGETVSTQQTVRQSTWLGSWGSSVGCMRHWGHVPRSTSAAHEEQGEFQ